MSEVDALGTVLPLWSMLPFAGMLLSIAFFPLVAPRFWHRHYPKVSAFWALSLAVPFVAAHGDRAVQEIVHILVVDYVPFIIVLGSLFTVAGGIYVGGTPHGTPRVNVVLLLVGTLLASWIGTTGASMVMIRPVLRANAWRRRRAHVICFFIFLVSNVGGALTPLGDPPLFLGFLHGVPFFWVTRALLLPTLVVALLVLAVFWWWDGRLMRTEAPLPATAGGDVERVRLEGAHNFAFLALIMGAVLFSGAVDLGRLRIYGHIDLALQDLVRDAVLILAGVLSIRTTRRAIRVKNEFGFGPMREVAYLFAGIFVTIVPALLILRAGEHGALAAFVGAVRDPAHFFWASGGLSSFLDNAPTYLTFFHGALGELGVPESAVPALLGHGPAAAHADFVRILEAISAGSVFMGAISYIGNAPNFMVKSIAEEAGVRMPSFFGYMLRYSVPVLVPSFLIVTLLFFR
ncbi:MAG: sodium:proton antiporter [bacterium]